MWHFIVGNGVGLGFGFVIGCFTPAIGRKLKTFLVGEEQKIAKKL